MHPALLLLLLLLAASPAGAEEVYGALLHATNENGPADKSIAPYEKRLKAVFGYDHYEVIGESRKKLGTNTEQWLIPSRELYLKVRGRRIEQQGPVKLDIKLFQRDKLLVESEAELSPGSPLFIRGPEWGKGQLVVLLVVR